MIDLDRQGDLWTLRLNRPDKANALTRDMLLEAAGIVEGAAAAKVLVLTGAGKVFSAGADLEAARAGLATDPAWERLSGAVAAFRGLSIAALNGPVAGGAMGMVLACDLRVAVPQVRLFYPVMKLGFLPQPSDPARLAALVGPSRARLILMAGERIDAATALDWGLVDDLVPSEALDDRIAALSDAALGADAAHIAAIKALLTGPKSSDCVVDL